MTAVSIIIPCFNRYELTAARVDSIQQHTDDYELVLVDNGSTDQTRFATVTVRNDERPWFRDGVQSRRRSRPTRLVGVPQQRHDRSPGLVGVRQTP